MIEYETANPAADDDIAGPGQVKEHESVTTAVRSSSPEPGARDIPTPGGTTIGSPLRNNWVMDGDGKISSESSSETSTIDTLSTWEALPVIGEGVENNSKANEAGWVEGPDIEQGLGKLKPVILRPGPRISPGSWKWPQ